MPLSCRFWGFADTMHVQIRARNRCCTPDAAAAGSGVVAVGHWFRHDVPLRHERGILCAVLAGLSESTQHIRLILDPSPRSDLHCSTCGSFSSTCTNVRDLHLVQVLAPLLLGAVATACICYPSRQAATLAQARVGRMAAATCTVLPE